MAFWLLDQCTEIFHSHATSQELPLLVLMVKAEASLFEEQRHIKPA